MHPIRIGLPTRRAEPTRALTAHATSGPAPLTRLASRRPLQHSLRSAAPQSRPRASSEPSTSASTPAPPPAPPPPSPRPVPDPLTTSDGFTYLQLDLPPPSDIKIKKSLFVKSSKSLISCPQEAGPEFAVIGRSNVGKSSLLNMLADNARLAKTSKEPGMTKLINHFHMNDSWFIVDLPGYGFAQTAGKGTREKWLKFTKNYFISRDSLVNVLLLVDSTLPPQSVDLECADWLMECEVPFTIVFTKMDLMKKGKDVSPPVQNIHAFKKALVDDQKWEALPYCFETSAKSGGGKSELLQYLASLRILHDRSATKKGPGLKAKPRIEDNAVLTKKAPGPKPKPRVEDKATLTRKGPGPKPKPRGEDKAALTKKGPGPKPKPR